MIKCVFKPHVHIWTWFKQEYAYWWGFPCSSAGKESACNAGDPGSVPGLGRSTGESIGYPLQYSWASLLAQLVKNPSAMQETPIWFLGWEDPPEKGQATHSSILGLPWWTQLVKNLPAMRETWIWSLGWEDLLERGKATHSSILAWRIPWTV